MVQQDLEFRREKRECVRRIERSAAHDCVLTGLSEIAPDPYFQGTIFIFRVKATQTFFRIT